mmetsp:Transcript_13046/g.29776  ORF Transcript_13046/g.29776 Transcript_13046/m.29776 type:complete len:298 (+) Transcript_13046:49-942(+)
MASASSRTDLVQKWLRKGGATPLCASHPSGYSTCADGGQSELQKLPPREVCHKEIDLAAQSESESSSNSDLEGMYAFTEKVVEAVSAVAAAEARLAVACAPSTGEVHPPKPIAASTGNSERGRQSDARPLSPTGRSCHRPLEDASSLLNGATLNSVDNSCLKNGEHSRDREGRAFRTQERRKLADPFELQGASKHPAAHGYDGYVPSSSCSVSGGKSFADFPLSANFRDTRDVLSTFERAQRDRGRSQLDRADKPKWGRTEWMREREGRQASGRGSKHRGDTPVPVGQASRRNLRTQ